MHATDDDHGQKLARKGDGERIGGGETMVKDEEHARKGGDRGGEHEGLELVAVGRVALEGGALFVLTDGDQHAAERRVDHAQ